MIFLKALKCLIGINYCKHAFLSHFRGTNVRTFLNDLRKCDILVLIIDWCPVVEYKFWKIVDLIEFDF